MKFMYLWPLALLILIPVIIIMYLMKQKATDTKVPSLFLWKEMYLNRESDTPWEKLKKNLLLMLQIITVLALVLALMGPYIKGRSEVTGSVAVLIDNSGSMSTRVNARETRLDKAKDAAVNFLQTLPSGTRITLIVCNDSANTLVSNTMDKTSVVSLIKDIRPTTYAGDISGGVKLCETMKVSDPTLTIAAFTDTYVPIENAGGTFFGLSGDLPNAGVNYVNCGYVNGSLMVLASISNHSKTEFETDLNLYGDNELLAIQSITLSPGETRVVYFENIEFDGSVVAVEINREDALDFDNRAYSLSENAKSAKVLLFTMQNLYLEKAVALSIGEPPRKSNDVEMLETFEKEGFDLYIFDGLVPEKLPETGNIFFINVPYDDLFTVAKELDGKYVKIEDTRFTPSIAGSSFGVSKVNAMEYPIWAKSFLSVEDEGHTFTAGFIGETGGRKICALSFDIHSSDLALRMEFPILFYSLINELADTSVLAENAFYCGNTVRIASVSDSGVSITSPDGRKKSYSSSMLNYKDTDMPGVYVFNEGGESEERFVVNFASTESGATGISSEYAESVGTSYVDVSENSVLDLRFFLIIFLCLLLAFEWIVFLRK